MERALKHMHILRVCIDIDNPLNCLIMTLFPNCIKVWGVATYTKYLSQIDRLLRRAFRLGIFNMKHRFNGLLKTGM